MSSDDNEVQVARDYLSQRKLVDKTLETHTIGYCKASTEIPKEIRTWGKEADSDSSYSYFIAGRIIVPIFSEFGEPVAFSTRKPSFAPDNTWWNLPFRKGSFLYLLNQSRKQMFEQNKIYLVEGYMDALILNQAGLQNVCGLMGTALTPRRVGLIARYCNNICLCMDSDENESGQKAQKKGVFILKEFGFCENISVIDQLPIGKDPDEYVNENGLDMLMLLERRLTEDQIRVICKEVRSRIVR